MQSPNNGGDKAPARHLLPPSETLSAGNGFHLTELFTRQRAPGTSPNNSGYPMAIGCSPHNKCKALLLKIIQISLNVKMSSWCLTKDFTPTDQHS